MSPVRSDLEDFAPIVDATRRGAHRARPSVFSEILPAVSVVVVIAVVTAVVLVLLGGNDSGGKPAAAGAQTPTASVSSTPTPTATPQETTTPTPTPDASTPDSTPTPDETDGAELDRAIKYSVLNDTDTSGLAKKAAAKLKDAGWTATATTGNTSPKGRYDTSVVFYRSSDDKAAAEQIASDLGIEEVTRSSTKSKSSPVTVVLGKDYTP